MEIADELARLAKMRDEGILTASEFEQLKSTTIARSVGRHNRESVPAIPADKGESRNTLLSI